MTGRIAAAGILAVGDSCGWSELATPPLRTAAVVAVARHVTADVSARDP